MYLTPEEHTAFLKSRREAQVLAQHYKDALLQIKRSLSSEASVLHRVAVTALENAPTFK